MRCAPGGLGLTQKTLPLVREMARFAHDMTIFHHDVRGKRFNAHEAKANFSACRFVLELSTRICVSWKDNVAVNAPGRRRRPLKKTLELKARENRVFAKEFKIPIFINYHRSLGSTTDGVNPDSEDMVQSAVNMLRNGLSFQTICDCTGLSSEEIAKLQSEA